MANSLREDINNKHVVINGDGPDQDRVVLVKGGFGSVPYTSGTALFALCIDGEELRFGGYDVQRLATSEEAEEFGRRVEAAVSAKKAADAT